MFLHTIILSAALICAVTAVPSPRHVLHERRDFEDETWIRRREVPAGKKLPVRIGMTQSNLDNAHDLLMEMFASAHTL